MCVPKNIPVKIKAKASWLTSSFLAANEKCCRHNLQHFLLFKFSSCPRGLNSRGGVREIAHLALAGKQEGGQGVHCTHYHARAHLRVHVRTSRTENIHILCLCVCVCIHRYYVYVPCAPVYTSCLGISFGPVCRINNSVGQVCLGAL